MAPARGTTGEQAWSLKNGVAAITGAASGIGAALAVELASRGMHWPWRVVMRIFGIIALPGQTARCAGSGGATHRPAPLQAGGLNEEREEGRNGPRPRRGKRRHLGPSPDHV